MPSSSGHCTLRTTASLSAMVACAASVRREYQAGAFPSYVDRLELAGISTGACGWVLCVHVDVAGPAVQADHDHQAFATGRPWVAGLSRSRNRSVSPTSARWLAPPNSPICRKSRRQEPSHDVAASPTRLASRRISAGERIGTRSHGRLARVAANRKRSVRGPRFYVRGRVTPGFARPPRKFHLGTLASVLRPARVAQCKPGAAFQSSSVRSICRLCEVASRNQHVRVNSRLLQ